MKLKIGLCQYSPVWENPQKSIDKIDQLLENIGEEELIIFPEMTTTGFTMNSKEFAEEIDGAATRYFVEKSRSLKKHIFAGIIENDSGKIYNTLVHFDKQGLITARYRKIHPFTLAEEEKHFSAGKNKVVTKIDQLKIGLTICYDLRFPELYRLYGKDGCELTVNIASWPSKRIEHWRSLLKANAIFNQTYVIGVNRIGKDKFHEYNGFSSVYSPMGDILAESEGKEEIMSIEIDTEIVDQVRQSFGFLNDIKLI